MGTYKVVELFSSIEGEGKRSGCLCTFIRLLGCNLRCSYCDTAYAFEADEALQELSLEDILERVATYGNHYVTLTGGEPLVDKSAAMALCVELESRGYQVNVETNGSIPILTDDEPILDTDLFYTMDWKSPSSSMMEEMCVENLSRLRQVDVLKFVVGSAEDLIAMHQVLLSYEIAAEVYVSPVWGQIELRDIVAFMDETKQDVRLQVQLHKLCWPAEARGV